MITTRQFPATTADGHLQAGTATGRCRCRCCSLYPTVLVVQVIIKCTLIAQLLSADITRIRLYCR